MGKLCFAVNDEMGWFFTRRLPIVRPVTSAMVFPVALAFDVGRSMADWLPPPSWLIVGALGPLLDMLSESGPKLLGCSCGRAVFSCGDARWIVLGCSSWFDGQV